LKYHLIRTLLRLLQRCQRFHHDGACDDGASTRCPPLTQAAATFSVAAVVAAAEPFDAEEAFVVGVVGSSARRGPLADAFGAWTYPLALRPGLEASGHPNQPYGAVDDDGLP
jgi:hypothetical protein